MSILSLLVVLVILCLLYWAVQKILATFNIGNPVAGLVQVVFVILVVFWLLGQFGFISPIRLR